MKKLYILISILLVMSFLLVSCKPATQKAGGLLGEIQKRGYLVVSTDPAYPPQSELVQGSSRATDTKCPADLHTANELNGFDIEVSKEIAKRLGVELCLTTPAWEMIISGQWADRWDLSIGSMTITPDRMDHLYFTQPYYTTPAAFFVHKDNTTFTQPSDLSGKKVGACSGCTYDKYLLGQLQIPGETITPVVKDVQFTGYDTDTTALQDLALGDGVRLDAVLTAQPTGAGAIADGMPLKQLGDPVFFEYLGGAIDKSASQDPVEFAKKVTELIQAMHQDGTLLNLSQKFYGTDLTTAASKFDVNSLNQYP